MSKKYRIQFTKKADKEFSKIDPTIRIMLLDWFSAAIDNAENPRKIGKALDGKFKGAWSYRKGNYRIICDIQDDKAIVLAIHVGHRKEIYKK